MSAKKYNTNIIFNTNNRYYNYFFANYLNSKYPKATCMNPNLLLEFNNKLGFTYTKGINIIANGYSQFYNKKNANSIYLLSFINSCKFRFVLLPILFFEVYNIIIYDTKLKQAELFNPTGISAIEYYKLMGPEFERSNLYLYNETSYISYIDSIQNLFKDIDSKIKFFTPVSFFPKDKHFLRFQIVDCDNIDFHQSPFLLRGSFSNFFINTINFSIAWSFYYIEKRLENPNKSRNVVVKELMSLFNKDVKSIKKHSDTTKGGTTVTTGTKSNKDGNLKLNLPICEIIKDYASFLQHLDRNVSFFQGLKVDFKMHKGEFVKYTKIILAGFLLMFGAQVLGKRQKNKIYG